MQMQSDRVRKGFSAFWVEGTGVGMFPLLKCAPSTNSTCSASLNVETCTVLPAPLLPVPMCTDQEIMGTPT
eukprot:4604561-Amphidinium_carterae.2